MNFRVDEINKARAVDGVIVCDTQMQFPPVAAVADGGEEGAEDGERGV